tara:strand:+ start:3398 stop:3604 length:207 start_codon:yes stop_codon:yes gene_type:complete
VKKNDQDSKTNNASFYREIETENRIKTTNVNILLNRVRLDQKKDFKKRLILFSMLAAIISSLFVLVLL